MRNRALRRPKAGRALEIDHVRRSRRHRANSAPWRDRCGRSRHDAACATPLWPSGNRQYRRAAWRYAGGWHLSSRAPKRCVRRKGAAARCRAGRQWPAPGARAGTEASEGAAPPRHVVESAQHRIDLAGRGAEAAALDGGKNVALEHDAASPTPASSGSSVFVTRRSWPDRCSQHHRAMPLPRGLTGSGCNMIYIRYCISRGRPMQVSKWGNSLGVRLPRAVVKALGLKEGDEIEITHRRSAAVRSVPRPQARGGAQAAPQILANCSGRDFKFDREKANARR